MKTQQFLPVATSKSWPQELQYNWPPIMGEVHNDVTKCLKSLRDGNPDAESRLLAVVYPELKRFARRYLRRERADHTLGPTDLVHEVYLRMVGRDADWRNRAHFFGVAAQAMRRVLVDYARAHKAKKRGEGKANVTFDDALFMAAEKCEDFLEVDNAVKKLSLIDARQARVVELRFFGDLSVEETAKALRCSARTVKRDWRFAQAWLRRELSTNCGDICNKNGGIE